MFSLTIFKFTLNLNYQFLFILCAFLISLIVIWYQAKKDGFDFERFFDTYLLSILVWVLSLVLFNYLALYFYYFDSYRNFFALTSFFGISFALILLKSKKMRWSIYRTLDIFSFVYFMLLLFVYLYSLIFFRDFSNTVIVLLMSICYMFLFIQRNKTRSATAFCVLLYLFSAFSYRQFATKEYLIFYFILITISTVILISRNKKSMLKRNLSKEFVQKIKSLLSQKKNRLKVEQKKLIEEDPYLQSGRDTGNAEETDEAILEDRAKVESDIKRDNIAKMEQQVDKAIEKMQEGDYGICEVCGEPIDTARLEAYPEATRCVKHSD